MKSFAEEFPFILKLSEGARREVAKLSVTEVDGGRVLLRKGEFGGGAYFSVGGRLRVYYITRDGREATLYDVERGETCVLAAASTFQSEPYPAWVEAGHEGARFIRVPPEMFRRWFEGEPIFREYIFGALSRRIFDLMRALEEASSNQMDERVARFLVRRANGEGLVLASQSNIAAELGTAREVVFRALRSLSERKLVKTGRSKVEILDRGGLQEMISGVE